MPFGLSTKAFQVRCRMLSFSLAVLSAYAYAQDAKICETAPDQYIGNSQDHFQITKWMSRGVCVRSHSNDLACYTTLEATLKNLNELRVGEYTGAASVLALLPTIGALLGAPTTEIWRLLTVVPFGGGLAMLLSFGGAILPVRVEDYGKDLSSHKVSFPSKGAKGTKGAKTSNRQHIHDETYDELNAVVEKIKARMRQDQTQRLPKGHLLVGLLAMVVLFVGAQAAMTITEQGGVLPWWCTSRWWMHLWYGMVTVTAIAENWAQLPFKETWKLFVSDIPYDIKVRGGDSIIAKLDKPEESVTRVLQSLASLKAGTATVQGSHQYTRPRNAVLVVISVVNHGDQRIRSLLRLLSKCTSIATFVTGTALFASVQLLALPMAVMVLTLVLAAGVYGRAITGWIVQGVSKTEPLIHVIVNSTHEAQHVIAQILSLDEYGTEDMEYPDETEVRKLQVELHGHVFVKQRRVAHRTPWYLRTWGVLAKPFDLRDVDMSKMNSNAHGEVLEGTPPSQSELELGLLRKEDRQGSNVRSL
ncbi:MAG: hypothetical protein L6R40_002070 [Gallowayella cf. fulva]|nr:MAG: hypothetical protein L6R40_002070 [Xanthomendoza cf. fulva]